MAPKKTPKPDDPTANPGKPLSYYAENRSGNEALSDATGPHEQKNWAGESVEEKSERNRKMQLKDQSDSASQGAAGAIPSYKKGGKIHKTGLARVHKGERVIPKSKVHKVEKAMRKVSRKRG